FASPGPITKGIVANRKASDPLSCAAGRRSRTGVGERGDFERNDDRLHLYTSRRRLDPRRVRDARSGARGFADAPDVHDADAGYSAVEGDMARTADDHVGRVVAEERVDLVVAHVVGQRLGRIGGGTRGGGGGGPAFARGGAGGGG